MGLKPEYRVTANDQDITTKIAERLESMTITDEVGLESDSLEITLADDGIKMPPTGAELTVSIGYDGKLKNIGMFVVDEIELTGWPSKMSIKAKAAINDKTPKGKKSLRSQQNREWKKGTTLKAIVDKIAKEHGMTGVVSKDIATIQIPHIQQTDESNLHFLTRIAKKYDAVVKPADGKLIVTRVGTGKSASGVDLKAAVINADVDRCNYSYRKTTEKKSGTVIAYYHNKTESKRHEVQVGSGDPVKRLKTQHSTKDEAVAAAKAEFNRRGRKEVTVQLKTTGNTDFQAEAPLTLEGFRDGVNGTDWIIKKVTHTLNNSGFVTEIEAEKKTSDKKPEVKDTVIKEEEEDEGG